MRLTLSIVKQIFEETKGSFLNAEFCKDNNGNIKISSFYAKWNDNDCVIKSVGDADYNEMVNIYTWMSGVSRECAKKAIWYRKNKESLIKQKTC